MQLSAARVRFTRPGAFARDLEASTNAYLDTVRTRDLPRMYLKSAIILAWFGSSWVALVFVAANAWQAVLAAISLGLAVAAVGMSVQHDANHGAYSRHRWLNRLFGATLDVMGISSFIWRPKHNVAHHTFTNVEGVDFDLAFGAVARLSVDQPRRSWHRYQHLYLWLLYGLLHPKWFFLDDYVAMHTRRLGVHSLPRPSYATLAAFVAWKAFFLGWAVVIPSLFHPLWQVLVFYAVAVFVLGATLGTVFQLAHCTGKAEFPSKDLKSDFAVHQLSTCVDFAPNSAIIRWFVGGLNYQVEHHLFPKVCHLHYPALSRIVATVAERHGLVYRSHTTFAKALAGHFHHLREMGRSSPCE